MLELVFLSGVRAGVVVPVAGALVAGRDAECTLEIPDPRVSRVHARFDWDGVRCELIDTDSSNGTFVNEKAVKRVQLAHGDVVRMGSTRLRVRDRRSQRDTSAHSAFGFADSQVAEMSHALPMQRLDEKATHTDANAVATQLACMIRVSELLANARSLDDLTEPVLDIMFTLLPQTDRAFFMVGDRYDALEARAMRQRGTGKRPSVVSRSICRAAVERKTAIVYREGGDGVIDPSLSMIDLDIRSAIAVPLMIRDEILGLVVLDTRDSSHAYGQRDLELAVAACHQISVAVKNAQLLRQVQEQTMTRNNLMRFLPQAMADQVLAGKLDAGLGGRKHRGAMLFSDIVGFTQRAEHTAPEQLVALLNRFFNAMVPCIEVDGGSVDKFMGDAILAVWGIPVANADSAQHAASAALSMQISLAGLNSEQEQPLRMGIGVSCGEVVAGNIGTDHRLEYTVLGDAVNTTQRIGAAACLEQVLVSEALWESLGGRAFGVRLPPLVAKNKTAPVPAYSLRGLLLGEEMQTFVPVRCGPHRGWLIRRLGDGALILLHEPMRVAALELATVELPDLALGTPTEVQELPPERGDGRLRRSLLRLPDPQLGGLLARPPTMSPRTWAEMDRAETAR